MHAFHNAHLIRQIIPRSLSAPLPLHQDRAAKHEEFSRQLRHTQKAKRKEQQEKRAAKKTAIAAAAAAAAPPTVGNITQAADSTQPGPSRKRTRHIEDIDGTAEVHASETEGSKA